MEGGHLYEFGPFRLDVGNARLLRDGEPIALPPKTFEVLTLLVRRAGNLVEKETLMREAWPDTFVEEANVSRHIWTLRKALGENEADERYIETVPKRGYRFTADVRTIDPAPEFAAVRRTETRIVAREETVIDDSPERSAVPGLPAAAQPHRRLWIAGAGVLVLSAVAAVWVSTARKPPPLTERDAILLADIANRTGDPVFDDTIKAALAVGLEQSPFLTTVSDDRVRETLTLMGRAADTPVAGEVARDICQREGAKAMLDGSIASLGSHYVISLEAKACGTGESLGRQQIEAPSKELVLTSLGTAAGALRGTLGESLASIRQFDVPLERAATSSLEALKAFSTGKMIRTTKGPNGDPEATPFFKRAIELDPDFAIAYGHLAAIHLGSVQRDLVLAQQYARGAFERRHHATDSDRLSITTTYYESVTGELDKAIETCTVWMRLYPNLSAPRSNLAVYYSRLGRLEEALDLRVDLFRQNPENVLYGQNLALAYVAQNRFTEARAVMEGLIARGQLKPGSFGLYEIAFTQGDAAAMQRLEADAARARPGDRNLPNAKINALTFGGQFRHARDVARGLGRPTAAERRTAATREALVGHRDEARRLMEGSPATDSTPEAQADAAIALALAGEIAHAQALIESAATGPSTATVMNRITLPTVRAALELQRGSAAAAITELQVVQPYERAHPMASYLRGQARLQQGDGTAAANEFKKVIQSRGLLRVNVLFPLGHLGLGRALTMAGDAGGAAKAYQDFFTLWKDADPDISILIEARKEFDALKP